MHGDHEHGDHRHGADADAGGRERVEADAAAAITRAFIDGFRAALDKQAFLALTGIPPTIEREGERLHLVEVRIEDRFTVGQVSRGFASADLVHQPLPAAMVAATAVIDLAYVGPCRRLTLPLAAVRTAPSAPSGRAGPG
ncbi:MAG TPA: hypothetical protein VES39_03000 [Rhodospirillales bacterium]|nr:hypothetical protein [Rhodospirillales bacterium]